MIAGRIEVNKVLFADRIEIEIGSELKFEPGHGNRFLFKRTRPFTNREVGSCDIREGGHSRWLQHEMTVDSRGRHI